MSEYGVIDPSVLPVALRSPKQWLVWRFETKAGDKKPRKVPHYVGGKRRVGVQGSDADRAALVDFETALAAHAAGKWDGLGFAFLPGDGLIGIDLDGMIDTDTGEISERGRNIIAACASYTEYSPSGRGVHIIVAGDSPTFKSNEVGVEVFCGRQYFTVTGRAYPGTPGEVNPISDQVLARLRATVKSAKKRPDGQPATAPAPALEGRAKVESALAFVSPECGFDDWIHIGMAICAELGSGSVDVWDTWSARSPKYPGRQVVTQHWKSFDPAGGITGATLFKLAMDAGWQPPKPPRQRAQRGGKRGPKLGDEEPAWKKNLLYTRGELQACLANVFDILAHDPAWAGVVALNEFDQRTVKLKPPPYPAGVVGEWDTTDDSRTAMWLSRVYRFTPSTGLVAEAVEVLARAHAFHPARDWLRTLRWDATPRLEHWLADFLGADKTEYSMRVARWFLVGMVARVLRPGVKFDYCLVLEGPQGRGKSTALAILGGEWFGDTDLDLHNKDSMSALQGKWLYEFAELGSLARAEAMKQKSFLSRQQDEYRPPYGRRYIRVPRQTVFAGSTNEWEWNKDPTGGRRFWPVEVGEIDLDALRAVRDQLFAEAMVAYDAGERFFPTAEEQRRLFDPEQLKREQSESLVDALHDWVFARFDAGNAPKPFSIAMAAMDGLELDAGKLTRDMQTRIGIALRKLGCGRIEKRNGSVRYWYTPPEAARATRPAQLSMEKEHART